jgi:glycosyltransferase involved in cell wall biosynthesis
MKSGNALILRDAGIPELVLASGPLTGETTESSETGPQTAGGTRLIRILVFTSLYPNAVMPRHGVFVEERLRHLVGSGRVSATVVAPVPWFPFGHSRFGGYAAFAKVPAREQRHGIDVLHPRYPVIPKIGMSVAPSLMYRWLLPVLQKRVELESFDLIDAHYFYPDGVAAAKLGAALGKPVVITARGSDLNVIPQHRLPRRQIKTTAARVAAIVTVSEALKRQAEALGIESGRISVLRNGVDLERFRPLDRSVIRARLGLAGPVWLAVGNLVELKGVHITLGALAKSPGAVLLVAGDGPEAWRLRQLASELGIEAHVRFLGNVPQARLLEYYNAADVLMLASSREGMPNVVLESLACGTPVVAAPFAGAEELISAPEAGEIAKSRTAEGMLAAWHELWNRKPGRAATRRFAENLGWGPVVEAQCALYAKVLAAHSSIQRTREAT